jgi:hypothetical protein
MLDGRPEWRKKGVYVPAASFLQLQILELKGSQLDHRSRCRRVTAESHSQHGRQGTLTAGAEESHAGRGSQQPRRCWQGTKHLHAQECVMGIAYHAAERMG